MTSDYKIETVQSSDKEEILKFLRTSFFKDEPICNSIKLLEGRSSCPELEDYSLHDFDSGFSFKAVSGGRIIGICLNDVIPKDYYDKNEDHEYQDPKFNLIAKFLDYVERKANVFSHYPGANKALLAKILGVDSSWRGRGIGKDLMDKTREAARENGCGVMFATCSSHFTALALKRLGFSCIYTLKYEDFRVDGKATFNPQHPHTAATIYAQEVV